MTEPIFIAIVAARFLLPLAIPKFPLPAVMAALILDAADQTLFASFGAVPDNYQSYDKALDTYYLTIAYVSTLRNWPDGTAFRTSRFLWYYRLVGVVAFELSGARVLLLIFPNTFEYFFIFYEAVRLRWDPTRLSARALIGAAAAIWILIKMPQEIWIHVAKLDVTNVLAANSWLWAVLAVLLAAVATDARRRAHHLPQVDWPLSFNVDRHGTTVLAEDADLPKGRWAILRHPLVEKSALLGLVLTIFLQLVPSSDRGVLEVLLIVTLMVVANSALSRLLANAGATWATTTTAFLGTGLINLAIIAVFRLVPEATDQGGPGMMLTLFLFFLLTLLVTLYDRYRFHRLGVNPELHPTSID